MDPFHVAANQKDIAFYRRSNTTSSTGAVTAAFSTINATITNIDVQPVGAEVLQYLETSRETVRHQCFVKGSSHDIENGDRCKDPLATTTPSNPDLEVFQLQKWPTAGGLPAHTEFLLRKVAV